MQLIEIEVGLFTNLLWKWILCIYPKYSDRSEQCRPRSNSVDNDQGPVVQSVVSLTSSLRVFSLTVLADSIHNILIFFAEKLDVNFNESLTNDIVSFEQLGPEQFDQDLHCLPFYQHFLYPTTG